MQKDRAGERERAKVSWSLLLFALMDNTNWGERYRTDAVREKVNMDREIHKENRKKLKWFDLSLKTQMQTREGEKHETYTPVQHTSSTPHPQHSIEWWCLNVCQGTKSQLNCVITSMLVVVMTTSIPCMYRLHHIRWKNVSGGLRYELQMVCMCACVNVWTSYIHTLTYRIRSRIHPQNHRNVHTEAHQTFALTIPNTSEHVKEHEL